MIISDFYPNQIICASTNPQYEYIVISDNPLDNEICIKAYRHIADNRILNLNDELLQHCRDFSIFSVSPNNVKPSIFSDEDIFSL